MYKTNGLRRVIALLIVAAVVTCCIPAVALADSVALSAPESTTVGEKVKLTAKAKGFDDPVYSFFYSMNGGKVKTFKKDTKSKSVNVVLKKAGELSFYVTVRERDGDVEATSETVTIEVLDVETWEPFDELREMYKKVDSADKAAINMAIQIAGVGDSFVMNSSSAMDFFNDIQESKYVHTAFLVKGAVSYSYRQRTGELGVELNYDEGGNIIRHILRDEKLTDKSTAFYDDLKAVLKDIIKDGMTDVEKAGAIHDYIVKNCTYGNGGSNASRTAYGMFYDKIGVCEGYAELFAVMATVEGMPCFAVTGEFGGEPHMWNKIKLDGEWYNVDCTTDDPLPDKKGRVVRDYFMKTDAEFEDEYTWYEWLWPKTP